MQNKNGKMGHNFGTAGVAKRETGREWNELNRLKVIQTVLSKQKTSKITLFKKLDIY